MLFVSYVWALDVVVWSVVMFLLSVTRVVGGVPLWVDVCVWCTPSCYSECGALCYLPDKLVWGYDHGLAIEGSNPKRTRLYFVILLNNVEKIFDWH